MLKIRNFTVGRTHTKKTNSYMFLEEVVLMWRIDFRSNGHKVRQDEIGKNIKIGEILLFRYFAFFCKIPNIYNKILSTTNKVFKMFIKSENFLLKCIDSRRIKNDKYTFF